MPANMDTLGTVTTAKGVVEGNCFAGVCNKILKNMEETNMVEQNPQEVNKSVVLIYIFSVSLFV